jgi:hypothetical protein
MRRDSRKASHCVRAGSRGGIRKDPALFIFDRMNSDGSAVCPVDVGLRQFCGKPKNFD